MGEGSTATWEGVFPAVDARPGQVSANLEPVCVRLTSTYFGLLKQWLARICSPSTPVILSFCQPVTNHHLPRFPSPFLVLAPVSTKPFSMAAPGTVALQGRVLFPIWHPCMPKSWTGVGREGGHLWENEFAYLWVSCQGQSQLDKSSNVWVPSQMLWTSDPRAGKPQKKVSQAGPLLPSAPHSAS